MTEEKNRINQIYDSLVDTEEPELNIREKEILHPEESVEDIGTESLKTTAQDKPVSGSALNYYDNREQNYQDLLSLIDDAEKELADLKFRKLLMESDFTTLLDYYKKIFVKEEESASAIAKGALMEYFTFELIKPLENHGLQLSSNEFSTWETKHFNLSYRLTNEDKICFSFMMPTSDGKLRSEKIKLMEVDPASMSVTVLDTAVLTLLKDCYYEHIYTSGQNSMFSREMNDVIAHMKELGFSFDKNLLDNSEPLDLDVQLKHQTPVDVLDQIFITTMDNEKYDFKKVGEDSYLVALDGNQTVTIKQDNLAHTSSLKLNTDRKNKSLIEFFGSYPFLVPLTITD
ncbi:hypothetical protein KQI33_04880 [Enterococcus devriesei]|uniref:hypothetical protein n=1 Tax=Enterococcus devriesei TaxID=319970 RepID=UPI001C10416A|nr:hypothetical protein [Enterococcus devriesei]MBU5364702.1 hypothetical protein [Enterococcus devriesei]